MAYPRYLRSRDFKKVIGTNAGDHSTTSASLVDISAAYLIPVHASVGDELEIIFAATLSASAQNTAGFRFAAAGVSIGPEMRYVPTGANHNNYTVLYYVHSVAAGDISGGTVSVKPQYHFDGSTTVTVRNASGYYPIFIVKNIGPPDPN